MRQGDLCTGKRFQEARAGSGGRPGWRREKLYEMQREWFLPLYGFASEEDFARFLSDKKIILDAGCGLGYKSAWLARLAPDSTVIGIDISDVSGTRNGVLRRRRRHISIGTRRAIPNVTARRNLKQ
jgi:SAM-dependent methyltransferase